MKKTKTLLVLGTGIFVGYKAGVKSGTFQTVYAWAVAHPDDPEAQEILENLEKAKDSANRFVKTVRESWENAGIRETFNKMVGDMDVEVPPRRHFAVDGGEECTDINCKLTHVEDEVRPDEGLPETAEALIPTHEYLATKFAKHLSGERRWMDIGPGAAESWGTSQELFDQVVNDMLSEGPGYVAYDLKYRQKFSAAETAIKVMCSSEYSEDAIRQIVQFEANGAGTPVEEPAGTNRVGMTEFEIEMGDDEELAQSWLSDPYKAPEQRKMAQEFLDSKKADGPPMTAGGSYSDNSGEFGSDQPEEDKGVED